MTALRRSYLTRRAGFLYTAKFSGVRVCSYCGEPADTRDHFLPLTVADVLDWTDSRIVAEFGRLLFTLPACRECNSVARNKIFRNLGEKRAFIHGRLRVRHRGARHVRPWSDEELAEVGPNLRARIETLQAADRRLRRRLNWPASRKW